MRMRTLRPGFFKSEQLAEVDLAGRILFAGLWCMADCEGRVEDRPIRIKGEVFPYDNIDVRSLLDDLVRVKLVARYEVGDRRFLWIPAFRCHQIISKKERLRGSEIPPHPADPGRAARKRAAEAPEPSRDDPERDEEDEEDDTEGDSDPTRDESGTTPASSRAPTRAPTRDHPGTIPGPPWGSTPPDTGIGDQGSEIGDRGSGSPRGKGGADAPPLSLVADGPGRPTPKRGRRKAGGASEVGARVLARINELAGKGYTSSPHIEARIAEGIPESDLMLVVETQWRREYMRKNREYFRPKTLFGPENFEEYLGAARGSGASKASGFHRPPDEDGYRYVDDDEEYTHP